MKSFKRILTAILSCVLLICALTLVAACKVDDKEEGYYVDDIYFISPKDNVIGNWYCTIPDGSFPDYTVKPKGYEALFNDSFYITVYYTAPDASGGHVGGYSMTINHFWGNAKTGAQLCSESGGVLQPGKKYNYGENQFYYSGSAFYTFEDYQNNLGYVFTIDGYNAFDAESIYSGNAMNFYRTAMTLEDCKQEHKRSVDAVYKSNNDNLELMLNWRLSYNNDN